MNRLKTMFFLLFLLSLSSPLAAQNGRAWAQRETDAEPSPATSFVHERDVNWEKRVWSELSLYEKKNQVFRNEQGQAFFIELLVEGLRTGELTAYADEQFKRAYRYEEVDAILTRTDTLIYCFDFDENYPPFTLLREELNPFDVMSYRIQEAQFINGRTGRLEHRILGLSPILYKRNHEGKVLAFFPAFHLNFEQAKGFLAKHKVFNPLNQAQTWSWADFFENKQYEAKIIKSSNLFDQRVKDYKASEREQLLEGERLKAEMSQMEQNLWQD